jgi:excisionase family DNA binding protein
MPITISGTTYYRTIEVCRLVGISRNTLYRWLREGSFDDVENIDRRGWRLYTQEDVDRLSAEANKISRNTQGGDNE